MYYPRVVQPGQVNNLIKITQKIRINKFQSVYSLQNNKTPGMMFNSPNYLSPKDIDLEKTGFCYSFLGAFSHLPCLPSSYKKLLNSYNFIVIYIFLIFLFKNVSSKQRNRRICHVSHFSLTNCCRSWLNSTLPKYRNTFFLFKHKENMNIDYK